MTRPNPLMTLAIDVLYTLLGLVALPVSLLRGRTRQTVDHLRRRLFDAPPARRGERRCLWIHGVSVGEVMSVRRLVERLGVAFDDWDVVVSSSTQAGVEAGRKLYPDRMVFSCPLDIGFAVGRAFRRVRPDGIVIVEHDLWPNLLRFAAANDVPVALVNARLSPKSLRGYQRLSRVYPWPPHSLARVCVQDESSAEGFGALGLARDGITVCGNLKFDNPAPEVDDLRGEIGFRDNDWVFVAGSTHEGEETAALDAFARVRQSNECASLILVPRRLERVDEIDKLIVARGYSVERWSRSRRKGPDVILVDTIGDLARLCAAADLVFVGGTLAPIGGHNVIEPASFARPIVIGPHFHSQKSIVTSFLAAQALEVAGDASSFVSLVVALESDRDRAEELGRRALEVVRGNSGSGDRTLEVLRGLFLRATGSGAGT